MKSPVESLKHILVGLIIGITSTLPGISGATMAVVFGIYERLIRDIAEIHKYIIKDFLFILLLVVGAASGIWVCSKVLTTTLEAYPAEALMFFIGLIVGQFFPIYRSVNEEKGDKKYTNNNISAFIIGIMVMVLMIGFNLINSGGDITLTEDLKGALVMFVIGIVVAVSSILPGVSHSTILLVFGLMTAFTTAVSDMNVKMLVPMALGALFGAIIFAKILKRNLERHHLTTMILILGLTVGSVAVITVNAIMDIRTTWDIVYGGALMIVGFLVSRYTDRLNLKLADSE